MLLSQVLAEARAPRTDRLKENPVPKVKSITGQDLDFRNEYVASMRSVLGTQVASARETFKPQPRLNAGLNATIARHHGNRATRHGKVESTLPARFRRTQGSKRAQPRRLNRRSEGGSSFGDSKELSPWPGRVPQLKPLYQLETSSSAPELRAKTPPAFRRDPLRGLVRR